MIGTGAESTVLVSAGIIAQLRDSRTPPRDSRKSPPATTKSRRPNVSRGSFRQQCGYERECPKLAAGSGRFAGNGAAGGHAVFPDGKCGGARFRISPVFVDGSRAAVERPHLLSSVDAMGERRLWRAAVHLLSTTLVDAGGRAGHGGVVEGCTAPVCRVRADARRT